MSQYSVFNSTVNKKGVQYVYFYAIYDATVLNACRSIAFCDDNTRASVMQSLETLRVYQKLCNVLMDDPLCTCD